MAWLGTVAAGKCKMFKMFCLEPVSLSEATPRNWHRHSSRVEVIRYPEDVVGGEPIFAPRNGTGEEAQTSCNHTLC